MPWDTCALLGKIIFDALKLFRNFEFLGGGTPKSSIAPMIKGKKNRGSRHTQSPPLSPTGQNRLFQKTFRQNIRKSAGGWVPVVLSESAHSPPQNEEFSACLYFSHHNSRWGGAQNSKSARVDSLCRGESSGTLGYHETAQKSVFETAKDFRNTDFCPKALKISLPHHLTHHTWVLWHPPRVSKFKILRRIRFRDQVLTTDTFSAVFWQKTTEKSEIFVFFEFWEGCTHHTSCSASKKCVNRQGWSRGVQRYPAVPWNCSEKLFLVPENNSEVSDFWRFQILGPKNAPQTRACLRCFVTKNFFCSIEPFLWVLTPAVLIWESFDRLPSGEFLWVLLNT